MGLTAARCSHNRDEEGGPAKQVSRHLKVAPRAGPLGHDPAFWIEGFAAPAELDLVPREPPLLEVAGDRITDQLRMAGHVQSLVWIKSMPTVRADNLRLFKR